MSKVCTKCNREYPITEFYKNNLSGYSSSWCKSCDKKSRIAYKRTKNGLLSDIYHQQVRVSIKRGHHLPHYTRKQLVEYFIYDELFNFIYETWVKSNYKHGLKPSVDRLNDYRGYSFDNIRITTWAENRDRGYSDKINGLNTKNCKSIIQFDLNNKLIKEHYSISSASRELNINKSSIQANCAGRNKTCHKFIFRYKKHEDK